jgi:penicillin-binding protein 2
MPTLFDMRCKNRLTIARYTNNRLRWLLAVITALSIAVLLRVIALELWYGAAYRQIASRPMERIVALAAARGRILAKDGTIMAYDRDVPALAIHYRYLEQPPKPAWLRRLARSRLPREQRKSAASVEAECSRLAGQQVDLHQRLADLCGLELEEFGSRLAKTQARIERIAQTVRARREELPEHGRLGGDDSMWQKFIGWMNREVSMSLPDAKLTVTEELEYHPVYVGLSLESVAEIEGHPDRYPGVQIVTWRQRVYPQGSLAAHAIGYLSDSSAELVTASSGPSGQQGVERQYDVLLRGSAGEVREATDRSGRLVWRRMDREAVPGAELVLTVDPPLQSSAEQLLDHALRRRLARDGMEPRGGGAVVAMDVETGALVCAASAPRFNPEVMARGDATKVSQTLADPARPLFDRACRMALPPGSVFKPLTAIALIAEGIVDPSQPFFCQGYLHTSEKQRCQIFRQSHRGHGQVTLADALAQSCNVYFFHFVEQLSADRLIHWTEQFGFGTRSGIDLPDEAEGHIVSRELPASSPTDVEGLAIGQSALTATPLQVARLMAAIANGGRLVTPHIVSSPDLPLSTIIPVSETTLDAVRRGLEKVVVDPHGTAYATVRLDSVSIAGKTGTAETGSGLDHAWFAGYAPVENPRFAFVVAIEHAGSGGEAAGPVARRLVERMESLGYFGHRTVARRAAP